MQDPTPSPAPSPIEAEVLRLRGLVANGEFRTALPAARALAARVPENRDALYLLAVCERMDGHLDAALATLARLEAAHPGFSRLYQERGIILYARGEVAHAIDSLLQAIARNPSLPVSWDLLEKLFARAGRQADAAAAAQQVKALKAMPPAVVAGAGLLADGDLAPAEHVLSTHVRTHPEDAEALRLLARVATAVGAFDHALRILESILGRDAGYTPARYDLACLLVRRHEHARARAEAERLLAADPANLDFQTVFATACTNVGDEPRARDAYAAILARAPTAAAIRVSLAHVQKTLGDEPGAIANYRLAAEQGNLAGYWGLADLKTYRFTDAEIEQMRLLEANPRLETLDRCHLAFALGSALDFRDQPAEAFAAYARGNALRRAHSSYRPEAIEAEVERQKAVFTPEFLRARADAGDPDAAPIFIVGLPRSGSTLVEQILAAHSLVEATAELPAVQHIVNGLARPGTAGGSYPDVLASLAPGAYRTLGARYLADAAVFRSGRPHFIDKMPNNFRHLGLIRLMLPNAKVIDVRREPMACCFSNFKQFFAAGQEFSYSLEDLGRYYRAYEDLMAHWDAVLPGWVLRVRLEDVVADFEASVRRVLGFCGLPFEAGCIDFQSGTRRVRTASAAQVRRPVAPDGLDRWRAYEPWLGPLRAALGKPA